TNWINISIHAPAKGATYIPLLPPNKNKFQSTHPQRVRRFTSSTSPPKIFISIHAPAKGATR
ncbi:TPA: hypothetical protein ACS3PN_001961, partial [Streptococcus agalactiae]